MLRGIMCNRFEILPKCNKHQAREFGTKLDISKRSDCSKSSLTFDSRDLEKGIMHPFVFLRELQRESKAQKQHADGDISCSFIQSCGSSTLIYLLIQLTEKILHV